MIQSPNLSGKLEAIQRLDVTASDTDLNDDDTWNEILSAAHGHVRDVAVPVAQFVEGIAGYTTMFGNHMASALPRATVLTLVRGLLERLTVDEATLLIQGIRSDLMMREKRYIPREHDCPWCRNPAQPRTEPNPDDMPF